MNEAPASVTIKTFSQNGYDVMLTIRDEDTKELLPRLLKALEWLDGHGFTPTTRNGGEASAPGTPVCQFHGPMKRSTKFDGWFCPSKMGDGSYCKEQVKD